ncbi:hypothetical protein ASF49_02105 [Methylobacterium sp. Leaf104]|uniref:hypothetical protein n=1 Tax=Methylobacterium TaxID=407 RepID=UPI0006F527C1|nr:MULTISPECIES: hypothetical protein [Methylobacterium]KQP42652.1 hypothetical protein ASF49_02105 [Methylobacterium sp. Leaf104]MCI9878783.1 hypothetical protein [Methylobacterium goesingense]
MTTSRQIKVLTAPLLARNPDLAHARRNILWLTPIDHVGRLILIDRTSHPDSFVVSWHIVQFFMPGTTSWFSLGRCGDRIARSKHFLGGLSWNWSDRTIYQDFVVRVEADILPLFRSLDTTRKCLEFQRGDPHRNGFLDHYWHLGACLALGEIEKAQALFSPLRAYRVGGPPAENAAEQRVFERLRALEQPLRSGDRAALCALLAQWEAENLIGSPLERYWLRTAFSVEGVG